MQEYLKLLAFLIANEDTEQYKEVLNELKNKFIELHEKMDIDLFYLSKQYIVNNCKKNLLPCEDIEALDKEINSMDDFITKLQIPKIAFISNKIESTTNVYTKESELYHDIRKILLNKDKYVRNYKPIINYYLSLIIGTLESEGEILGYDEDPAEVYQFKEIIRLAKVMLKDAPITPHHHVSLVMRNDPFRIKKIAERYK